MRPILAVFVAFVILGSVGAYSAFVRTLPPLSTDSHELVSARGEFAVDITLTFDAQPDAFSLEPTSIFLRFEGHDITIADPIRAGQPVRREIPNLRIGANDIYVEVHVPEDTIGSSETASAFSLDASESTESEHFHLPARAVRIRVLRDGVPIDEQTLWSEPGLPIRDTITLTVSPQPATDDHDH